MLHIWPSGERPIKQPSSGTSAKSTYDVLCALKWYFCTCLCSTPPPVFFYLFIINIHVFLLMMLMIMIVKTMILKTMMVIMEMVIYEEFLNRIYLYDPPLHGNGFSYKKKLYCQKMEFRVCIVFLIEKQIFVNSTPQKS